MASLDYAPPRHSHPHRRVIALVLSAVAVGWVGKLCWEKFAGPAHARRVYVRAQNAALTHSWQAVEFTQEKPRSSGVALPGQNSNESLAQSLFGSRFMGVPLYYGQLDDRHVFLTLNRTEATPVSSLTLVLRSFSPATMFTPARESSDAQILPLITYRSTCRVDPVRYSPMNKLILVLSGNRDGTPFRFELSLDRENRARLVEDTSVSTTAPAHQ